MIYNKAFETSQRALEAPALARAQRIMAKYPIARLYFMVGRESIEKTLSTIRKKHRLDRGQALK